MNRLGWIVLCGFAAVACGCGKSTKEETSARTALKHSQSGPTTSATSSVKQNGDASAATNLPAEHLLTHPTARPPGVSAQFEYVGGAGPGACFTVKSPPRVQVLVESFPGAAANSYNDTGVTTYGQPVDVCLQGMGRGPISVSVRGPKGFTMSGALPALPDTPEFHYQNEWTPIDWVPAVEPSWPVGRYLITARSSVSTQSHRLTVVLPREQGLRVLGPSTDPGHNTVAPNSHATVFLTGFAGMTAVTLSAYETTGFESHAQFFAAANVPIPQSGDAVVQIPTGAEGRHAGAERTFILTARANGRTLFAPFTVSKTIGVFPNLIVGRLPSNDQVSR